MNNKKMYIFAAATVGILAALAGANFYFSKSERQVDAVGNGE